MAKNKRARFAINVDSGVVVFRSESTDALKTIWKLIDDETASMIVKKKISARAVIEAIQKSVVQADGFNWREYDKKRKEELKLFNVSERDLVPAKEAVPNDTEEDEEREDAEVLSLKDLGLAKTQDSKPAGKQKQTGKQKQSENSDPRQGGNDAPAGGSSAEGNDASADGIGY